VAELGAKGGVLRAVGEIHNPRLPLEPNRKGLFYQRIIVFLMM